MRYPLPSYQRRACTEASCGEPLVIERNLYPSPSNQSENSLEYGKGQKLVWCIEKMSDKEWTATRRSIWYKSVACEILPAL
jgi:hypothetical protein